MGIGPDDIGIIDSDADGWAVLERQLQLFASRGMTLEMAIYEFAKDSAARLAPDMSLKQVLEISA
jgi:hypothetical protein